MSTEVFLAKGSVPPLQFAPKRQSFAWLEGDSEEDYKRHGGHPIYGKEDIEYCFNHLGYRSRDFDTKADIRIAAIGCSYVMGIGLPQQDIFHEVFARRLGDATGKSVVVLNLGAAGGSNDYISRLLHLAVPALNPDIVLVNFTHAERREYLSLNNQLINYNPSYTPRDLVTRDLYKHFAALNSPLDDLLNLFRNYKSIEALLCGRQWLFSAISSKDFEQLREHIDCSRYVGALQEIDKARDWKHPGPKSHEALAELYWQMWCRQVQGASAITAHWNRSPAASPAAPTA